MGNILIIAEAGVNHNGSTELAKQLIDVAAQAGVDYVKFQTFKAENLVSKTAQKADYQKRNTEDMQHSDDTNGSDDMQDSDDTQFTMLKKLELTAEQHYELIDYCHTKGVKFFSTAFDLESIDFLSTLNLGLWKIPSGEITNYPYLKRIASHKEPVIMSTGMSTVDEIREAMDVLIRFGVRRDQLTVLHCNTEYPTPMDDVNLKAMQTLSHELGVPVGYSDHTQGIEVPIAAVALGASVIEKHFTLERNMEGPDHKASLEPDELKAMVLAIRNIEKALGDGVKAVSESERKNKTIARKSIVASKEIKYGELLTEENLTVKRPGTGLSPMMWEQVIGTRANRDYQEEDIIR